MNYKLSTGHKELDDILSKNGIDDLEKQESDSIKKLFKNIVENNIKQPKKEIECLHVRFNRSYIERGLKPPTVRMISCPCKRCSPCSF